MDMGAKFFVVVVQEKPRGCSLGTSRSNSTTVDEGKGIHRGLPNDLLLVLNRNTLLLFISHTQGTRPFFFCRGEGGAFWLSIENAP